MHTNKFFVFFIPRKSIWWVVISIFLIVAAFASGDYRLISVASLFLIAMFLFYFKKRNAIRADFEQYLEELSMDMSSAAQNAMMMLSMPIAVINTDGEIIWENSFFMKQFTEKALETECIQLVLEQRKQVKQKSEYDLNTHIEIGIRSYNVIGKMIKKFDGMEGQFLLLYFFDNTEMQKYKKKSINEKPVMSVIVIDNYDDLMQSMEDAKRPLMLAEIDAKIQTWANLTGGILRKYERDKYIFIFQQQYIRDLEEKKYEILEIVKEISLSNKIPVTLSIGIDNSPESFSKSFQFAVSALDIALGRGGDQVVYKSGEHIQFFGGKTKDLEKRTRVKARVIAHALREVINQASQVMVMGHTNCDVDALGSAVGVYKIAANMGKKSNIVLSQSNPTIEPFMQRISHVKEYDGVFIDKTRAVEMMSKDTLLIVVDTHRPMYTECPDLLKMTTNVVVFDHHRRGADFIQDAVLSYQETYASSTCELVTEVIQYIEEHVSLESHDAELLYAGIVVDTKGFNFKTGVRTFEAAAYLRKKGVDTIQVKQLLQNDLASFISISNIVKEVKIHYGNIAISACPNFSKNSILVIAQAADQIMGIAGVGASFVVADTGNAIFISGRSFGDVNVQVILEKIGGGGHQTVAGAQFYGETLEQVLQKLHTAIDEYRKEMSKEP